MGGRREPDSQTLNDTEGADAKIVSKDREKPIEENRGPADFGEEEDEDLSNDQKSIEDGPEDAGRLVGNGRVTVDIALAGTRTGHRRIRTEHNRDLLWSNCAKRTRPTDLNRSGRS
jgi:hypothetical protein